MASPSSDSKLLLVGLDGADWQLIHPLVDNGQMPNLAELVERGTIADLWTLDPSVCVMHWCSILTGRRAGEHGVTGQVEVDEAVKRPRAVWRTRLTTPTLQTVLTHYDASCINVGWPVSFPAESVNGVVVTDTFARPVAPLDEEWPIVQGQVSPAQRAEALAGQRLHPGEFNYHDLRQFFPNATPAGTDPRLAEIARVVAEAASVHGIATALLETESWRFCSVYYDVLNAFCRSFMAYHPPRMSHIEPAEFDTFNHVVTQAYCFVDEMIGRLVELAGPDSHVLIVSDHGFHSDNSRPRRARTGGLDRTARWHRPTGMLCLAGPKIRSDSRVYGAGPLDIMPTVMQLLDLPVAADLPGRVLRDAFTVPPSVESIDSWSMLRAADETIELDVVRGSSGSGYLQVRDVAVEELISDVRDAEQYNLARALLGANEVRAAIPLFESLVETRPGELRFQIFLADSYFAVSEFARCRTLVNAILTRENRQPRACLILARLCLQDKKPEQAMRALRLAESAYADQARHDIDVAGLYLVLDAWQDAQRCLLRALSVHEHDTELWTLLCRCHTGQGQLGDAIEAGQSAVGYGFDFAASHLHLGIALLAAGNRGYGVKELETCLQLTPGSSLAHALLSDHYEHYGRDAALATYHRSRIRRS